MNAQPISDNIDSAPLFNDEDYKLIICLAVAHCPEGATQEQILATIKSFENAKIVELTHRAILEGLLRITGYDDKNDMLLSRPPSP